MTRSHKHEAYFSFNRLGSAGLHAYSDGTREDFNLSAWPALSLNQIKTEGIENIRHHSLLPSGPGGSHVKARAKAQGGRALSSFLCGTGLVTEGNPESWLQQQQLREFIEEPRLLRKGSKFPDQLDEQP